MIPAFQRSTLLGVRTTGAFAKGNLRPIWRLTSTWCRG